MNSNGNKNDPIMDNNNNGGSADQLSLLGPKFMEILNRKLVGKIALLESEIKEITASNAAFGDDLKIKCEKIKKIKADIKASKQRRVELEKTRDNVERVGKNMTNYVQLMKTDLKNYQNENLVIEKKHGAIIEDTKNKWQTYEAQYERLPLAITRAKEEVALQKAKIKLMVQEYKIAEKKKGDAKLEEIATKQRNNIAIKCAELYKESKLEDLRMRIALETKKNLLDEISKQEKTIAELKKKRKNKITAPQALLVENKPSRNITHLQNRLQPITRYDLSSFVGTLTKPLPTYSKDNYDTISISSSIIDNMINVDSDLPLMETNGNDDFGDARSDNNGQTSDAAVSAVCFVNPNDINLDNASNNKTQLDPAPNVIFEPMQDENEETETEREAKRKEALNRFDEESMKFRKTEYQYDSPKRISGKMDFGENRKESERRTENEGPSAEENSNRNFRQADKRVGRPTVINIENFSDRRLNFTQSKPMATPKSTAENSSLGRYFAASSASSVDYNWKADLSDSFKFSFTGAQQGNPELESIFDSEISLHSEDMIKKFHIPLSPDLRNRKDYRTDDNQNQDRFVTSPQVENPQCPQIGEQDGRVSQFLDIGGGKRNTNNQGKKKDTFFLSMF